MTVPQAKKLIVGAVALHSIALGVAMLLRPTWTLEMSGWEYDGPSFFPAQSGIFLFILGGAYTVGIWQRPFAWFLVATKAVAVAFLVTEYVIGAAESMALVAAGLDGLMGITVAIVLTCERRARRVGARRADRTGGG